MLPSIYRATWQRFLDRERTPAVHGPLPWEHERLLDATGWTVLDGWGSFGPSFAGDANEIGADENTGVHNRPQQAVVTTWATIAARQPPAW